MGFQPKINRGECSEHLIKSICDKYVMEQNLINLPYTIKKSARFELITY